MGIGLNPSGALGSVKRRQKQQNKQAEALGIKKKPYRENLGKKVRNYTGEQIKKNVPGYKKLIDALRGK